MVDIVGRDLVSLAKATELLSNAVHQEIAALGADPYSLDAFSNDDDVSPALLQCAAMASFTLVFFRYYSRDVFLCHPKYQSLKTSSAIFERKLQTKFPLLGADGLAALALNDKSIAQDYASVYFDGPFANISLKTGRVSTPHEYKFSFLTLPSRRRRLIREMDKIGGQFSHEFRAFCYEFAGWYVGFDEENLLASLREHVEWTFSFDINRLWSMSTEEQRKLLFRRFPLIEKRARSFDELPENMKRPKGRPRIPNLVERFNERWPLGFEEVTLSHAARELGCDRKTLRTALEEVGVKRE
ncbi:hypothetical protein [Donghicola eburneus]|uniref:Uncharacterized protein n=1 Tax=Donghicola eburneus TaxID=393278 RepID=A0A1M4MXG2_9RHOB|nr:hypothetical protein [Donghicola eburneus]SCM67261.1 hypothetical protein KARMA_1458 [Donghicola eburneus]SFQ80500.1 hypothetical protein SAMN05421764_1421 [Donghicola eburneus]